MFVPSLGFVSVTGERGGQFNDLVLMTEHCNNAKRTRGSGVGPGGSEPVFQAYKDMRKRG